MKLPTNQLNDYIAGKKRIVKIRPNRIYKEERGFVKSLFWLWRKEEAETKQKQEKASWELLIELLFSKMRKSQNSNSQSPGKMKGTTTTEFLEYGKKSGGWLHDQK